MKRSGGITASAVVTIIGSLIFLLLGTLVFLAMQFQGGKPEMPAFAWASLLFIVALMFGFSAWGIATAVGLLRLRAWSRVSILIFSGILVSVCGYAVLMKIIAPFPEPASAPALTSGMRAGMTIFYGVLALLGADWLYFFNRAQIKARFTPPGGEGMPLERPRPLSVSIIAGLLLFSAAGLLTVAFFPLPATFLGFPIGGLPGHLLYLGYGGIALWLGVGLLRLKLLARTVALGFCTFMALNSVLFVAVPGFAQRINTSISILPPELHTVRSSEYARQMVGSMSMSTLFYAVPIWFLVTRREAFSTTADNPASKRAAVEDLDAEAAR